MTNSNHVTEGAVGQLPRPAVTDIYKGTHHTVVQGTGSGAAFMPEHYCTHEAVMVVVEGRVEIELTESEETCTVNAGECYVIRPRSKHTLSSLGAFRLFLTMPPKAEIRFKE